MHSKTESEYTIIIIFKERKKIIIRVKIYIDFIDCYINEENAIFERLTFFSRGERISISRYVNGNVFKIFKDLMNHIVILFVYKKICLLSIYFNIDKRFWLVISTASTVNAKVNASSRKFAKGFATGYTVYFRS